MVDRVNWDAQNCARWVVVSLEGEALSASRYFTGKANANRRVVSQGSIDDSSQIGQALNLVV